MPLLNIRPGEGRVVGLLLLHSVFYGVTISLSYTATVALFLKAYGAAQLPWVYIAAASVIVLTGAAYSFLEKRLAFGPLFMLMLGFLALTGTLFRAGFAISGASWLAFGGLIWFRLLHSLIGLEFWGLAGRLLTLQQGKRLFGLIGGGELLVRVLVYASVPLLVAWMGTTNLLLLAVISLVGCLLIVHLLSRDHNWTQAEDSAKGAAPQARPERSVIEAKGDSRRSATTAKGPARMPFVQGIAAASFFTMVLYFLVDFGFLQQARGRYPNADALASFLGVFNGVVYGGSFLLRTFLSGPLLKRFGLRLGILVQPASIVGPLAAIALVGGFGAAGAVAATVVFIAMSLTRLLTDVLRNGISRSSFVLLYQPLERRLRMPAQAFVEGVGEPLGIATAGVLLLAFRTFPYFTTVHLAYVMLAFTAVWLLASLWVYRGYLSALRQALTSRKLQGGVVELRDSATLTAVRARLASGHPGEIVYALDLLDQAGSPPTAAELQRLLAHADPLVRTAALARVTPASGNLVGMLRQLVETDPDPAVVGAAMEAWARVEPSATVEHLAPFLEAEAGNRAPAAMIALLRHGGIAGVLAAGGRLLTMIESPCPEDRIAAAIVLGSVETGGFYQPLLNLVNDRDPAVAAAAIAATGRAFSPHLLPSVIAALGSPRLGRAAAAALAQAGDAALPGIATALADPLIDRNIASRLASVLGQIGSPAACEILRSRVDYPDSEVRTRVLQALHRARYRPDSQGKAALEGRLHAEFAGGVRILVGLAALAAAPSGRQPAMLASALQDDLDRTVSRLFYLLSFLHDRSTIMRARDTYLYAATEKRGYALEVLDTILPQAQKSLLFPLIDDLKVEERLRAAAGASAASGGASVAAEAGCAGPLIYAYDAPHFSDWTKACALYMVDDASPAQNIACARASLAAPQPLVREAALWALGRSPAAAGPASVADLTGQSSRHLAASMVDDPDPRVGRVARYLADSVKGERPMLTTIDKLIILRTVDIFSQTTDATLVEIAQLLEEVELQAGERLFDDGDPGNSMYVIVTGRVRVHVGARDLDELGERQVFGEMAVLDPAPRSAAVSALADTLLLRLDQEPLNELMESRSEVGRGMLQVIIRRLRMRVNDLAALRDRLSDAESRLATHTEGTVPSVAGQQKAEADSAPAGAAARLQPVERNRNA